MPEMNLRFNFQDAELCTCLLLLAKIQLHACFAQLLEWCTYNIAYFSGIFLGGPLAAQAAHHPVALAAIRARWGNK